MNKKLILSWGVILAAITFIITQLVASSNALIILGALVLSLVASLILAWAIIAIVDN